MLEGYVFISLSFGGSTMFDQLFNRPLAPTHYRTSPLLEERLAYLRHLASHGYTRITLRGIAQHQLAIMKLLGLDRCPHKRVTLAEVKRKTSDRQYLYPIAIQWLRFTERLPQPRLPQRPVSTGPCAKKIRAFADYMKHDKGLSPITIQGRCSCVARFLKQLKLKQDSLQGITPHRIDVAFQKMLNSGSYARITIKGQTDRLRVFFRFAETRGWCRKGLADSIRGPRIYSQTSLPVGPSRDDVRRLLATTEGNRRNKIRARAILMLFAIYGLRAGEVSRLRLEDFDWEREEFRVASSKSGPIRTYPLMRSVGDAILRYLREARQRSPHREVFLSLRQPFPPISVPALWSIVGYRLRTVNVSLPHHGPHSLRHACAEHLLATGMSLKEIGDQLGHKDPESTRIYAKVDLVGLRQVANFDLGGVQ